VLVVAGTVSDTETGLEEATGDEEAELEMGTRDGLDTGDWVTGV
jgi:hypothetical protein